jgi:osmotically-inducible protein OsmY
MDKNRENVNRSGRNREQQPEFQNRNTRQNSGPYEGLSPNYESNYKPGEYGHNQNRFTNNRNGSYEDRNRFDSDGYFQGHAAGSPEVEWHDSRNEGSYNTGLRENRFPQDEEQYDYNRSRGVNESQGRRWQSSNVNAFANWPTDQHARSVRDLPQDAQHRGKGPKGYVRTDERITEDVNEKLTDDGYVNANDIEVQVRNGDVILSGTVQSRQEKRRAEDIIERVSGVKDVENRIKVISRNTNTNNGPYTNGLKERNGGLEYGPGAVSGMANTSATGDFNTAR